MNVKTESRILLTVVLLVPFSLGALSIIFSETVIVGWPMFIGSIVGLLWVWKPWRWFQKGN
jgi:hypothetical protein